MRICHFSFAIFHRSFFNRIGGKPMSAASSGEKLIAGIAGYLSESRKAVVFTGAGISTESGIPDFRSPAGVEVPRCDKCGGLLKSGTVSFGQALPADVLTDAIELCNQTDLMLAIGSSLVVEPAASLPLQAKHNGARLVIINKTETPLDYLADVIVREPIGETLTRVVHDLGLH